MLSQVNPTLHDANTGASGGNGTGNSGKIGVSSITSDIPILVTANMTPDVIKKKLGNSPLADACIDAFDLGASNIYALPVAAGTQGTISAAVHVGDGSGTVTASGNPNNDFTIIVKIESSGSTNEATCSISEDGGVTWEDEQTIPLGAEITVPNTGVTLTFSADSVKPYIEGDTYTFKATAPTATNQAILSAAATFRTYHADIEWIHVVGTTTSALWTSLETFAATMETDYRRPIFFICEQRAPLATEDAATYVDAIFKDAKSVKGRHVCVVSQWARYTRMDGRVQTINLAGMLTGILSSIKESTSAAYVRDISVSEGKILELVPEGIEDYIEQLDEARYTFFRHHNGLEGWYIAATNMTALPSSDFSNIEDVRVAYRIIRQVTQRALLHQNMDYDQSEKEVELKKVETDLQVPVDKAKTDKIISDGEVKIDMEGVSGEGRQKTIPVNIRYVPRGYATIINLDFYVVNSL